MFLKEIKKINLIPDEVRDKYAKRYIIATFVSVLVVFAVITGVQYSRIGLISFQIKSIKEDNVKYNVEKEKIAQLTVDIEKDRAFIKEFEKNSCFPFTKFMIDSELNRPSSVNIISIDTEDRLINEGEIDEDAEKKKEDKENKNENEKEKDTEEKDGEEQEEEIVPEIKYDKDLAGQIITIRGYSESQADISKYIYAISNLPYINNTAVTGVEKHIMPDFKEYNIFELRIEGGVL